MKKLKFNIFILSISLLSTSCQEDFNPRTEFKELYVLESYIDLDYDMYKTTCIYATVTKLYDVEGLDSSKNKIDPYVSGAGISVYYRGDSFQLKEYTGGIIAKRPPPVLKYKYYYSSYLQYIYPNYPMSITAVLPGGKTLSANIQLLSGLQLGFSYNFERGFTAKINRFLFGNVFTIDWGYADGCLFFPKLVIPYRRKDTGYTVYYKEVPCTYINRNGHSEPVYPSPTSGNSISYDFSAVDSAMAQVSHVENFDYYTGNIIFQMIEMDRALSNYYESIHGSTDSYSISLDQPVYSNISGGLGIFGSKRTISKWWNLDQTYIVRFLQKK